ANVLLTNVPCTAESWCSSMKALTEAEGSPVWDGEVRTMPSAQSRSSAETISASAASGRTTSSITISRPLRTRACAPTEARAASVSCASCALAPNTLEKTTSTRAMVLLLDLGLVVPDHRRRLVVRRQRLDELGRDV